MTNQVGLIGCGVMGFAIGSRLLETGNTLHVFDLDKEKVAELVALGAVACGSAAEVGEKSDAVITSLNSAKIVDIAAFGDGGIAAGAKPGTLIIDLSSIDPDATKDLASKAAETGPRWVCSPLSGGARTALIRA